MMGVEDKKETENSDDTYINTSSKKKEKAVKINVGGKEEVNMNDENGADGYNPYLYDASGPKKKVDYSRPECESDYLNYDDQGVQA